MQRRDFIGLVAGSAAAVMVGPPPLGAQPVGNLHLGALLYGSRANDRQMETALRTLREAGYVEGKNLIIDYRYAEGVPERLPGLAAELVALRPGILLAIGGDVAPFVKLATLTIPIVFAISADPERLGLVESVARPGGNATGVTFLQDELAAKRVQLFKELVPRISRMAILWNPDHPDGELRQAASAAQRLGFEIVSLEARDSGDVAKALQAAAAAQADALYVVSSRLTSLNLARIVGFATQNRLPMAGGWGQWAQAGALMSYGPNVGDMVGEATVYVTRIHKGAKPADLPVLRPSKFELVINMKTAAVLSLAVPNALLAQAEAVIE